MIPSTMNSMHTEYTNSPYIILSTCTTPSARIEYINNPILYTALV